MKFILCIASLFFVTTSFAQTSSVEGKIIGNSNNEPIGYASISLLGATDTSLITGVLSDSKGQFKIEKLGKGNYLLKIQFIGYDTKKEILNNTGFN